MGVKLDTNYPEAKVTKSTTHVKKRPPRYGKNFPWKRDCVGVVTLITMWCYINEQVTDQELALSRNFSKYIGNGDRLVVLVKARIPCMFARYYKITGNQLTANVLYNRIHKMYLLNSPRKGVPGQPAIGPEHPINNRYLRHYVSAVEQSYRLGWRWTEADCVKLINAVNASKNCAPTLVV